MIGPEAPAYVYIIHTWKGSGLKWYVGSTDNLIRRLKAHKRKGIFTPGTLYGLVPCPDRSIAYILEYVIYHTKLEWTNENLQILTEELGGTWNDKGLI